MTDRPNFLFIITDQHRGDWLGCNGHPVQQTPHIDSIAARGRNFSRFYVANPVCMPNRSTLVTGRMPSAHGVRSNGIPLSRRYTTFIDLLRAQGWRTALLGKSHLMNMTGHAAIQKRPEPAPGMTPVPPGYEEAVRDPFGDWDYRQETPERWEKTTEAGKLDLPFYGFEHVDLCTGHGDQVGGQYYQWLRAQTPEADMLRDRTNQLPHDYVCPQAVRTAVPEELYPTHWVTERTLDWLDAMKGSDAPFFASVAYPDPHHPFTPPGKYWGMYDPADMVLPPSYPNGDNRPVPSTVEWLRARRADGSAVLNSQTPFALSERELREAMALTCGMVQMIDDGVGRILKRLEENGMAENTVVIFTADHGDFMGDHGIILKGPIHYSGITRVPFIWADTPDRASAGANATLAGTVDIASTILERAGLEPYWGIQGRSLMPLMDGTEDSDAAVIIEEDSQRAELGFNSPPRLHSLVTRDWRLSIYDGVAQGELYNLTDDPHEMTNRFDDPGYTAVKGELFERMARMRVALIDRAPLPTGRA
jgi:arylsulfatase A-like enzyme